MSVLLVEETRVPRENYQPVASHCKKLYHIIFISCTRHHEQDFNSQF